MILGLIMIVVGGTSNSLNYLADGKTMPRAADRWQNFRVVNFPENELRNERKKGRKEGRKEEPHFSLRSNCGPGLTENISWTSLTCLPSEGN